MKIPINKLYPWRGSIAGLVLLSSILHCSGLGIDKEENTDAETLSILALVQAGASSDAARVTSTSNITIPNSTFSTLTFDTEVFDQGNLFDAGQPTRLTAATTGIYLISASVQFGNNQTGMRHVNLTKNGSSDFATESRNAVSTSGFSTYITISTVQAMSGGDYVEVRVFQNSGASMNVAGGVDYSPIFTMHRVAN